jgi:hypothetical protein
MPFYKNFICHYYFLIAEKKCFSNYYFSKTIAKNSITYLGYDSSKGGRIVAAKPRGNCISKTEMGALDMGSNYCRVGIFCFKAANCS